MNTQTQPTLTKSQIINLLVNKFQVDREWCNNQNIDALEDMYTYLLKTLNKK